MLFSSNKQGGFFLRLTYLLLTWFFHAAIFVVALVGLANFWMPLLADYKSTLEKELSGFVGNNVTIGEIRVDRNSETPRWILTNLQLTEASGYAPIYIEQLALSLDWRESLRTLRLQPADIELRGVEFVLRQQGDALPDIQGLSFPLPGQKNTALNVERQSALRVSINGGFVHWMDATNRRTLALGDLQLNGEILPNAITLQAEASFPSEIGEKLGIDAVLTLAPDAVGGAQWNAAIHARTRIFNLAALPSPQLQAYGVEAGGLLLDVNIQSQAEKPLDLQGEGVVTQLSLRGTKVFPALQNINADFQANTQGGKVNIAVEDSPLVYAQWFERPLMVDALQAQLQWQVNDAGWDWELMDFDAKNPDVWVKGVGKLAMPLDKSPNLDLNMTFATQRTVDNVRDYIPSVVIDSTEDWLKTAIVSGYVPKGEFVLRGNPADFPFQDKPGVFDIRFDIENGVLAYLPEWPVAKQVQGELHFHNAGMAAKVKRARIMDLDVIGGTVDIPDMLQDTHLLLDLETQGDLYGHMDYLQSAPIGKNLRDFMRVAKFAGNSRLHLKLDVPLDSKVFQRKGVSVDGKVSLKNNSFSIPNYQQSFSKLKGEVRFDQYGVSADAVTGEYLNQPVRIKAATNKTKGMITVDLQQSNELAAFLPPSLQSLAGYLHGKTPITTHLELPAFDFSSGKRQASLKVHATSQLRGVAVQLPAPLGKTAAATRDVTVNLEIPFDTRLAWQAQVAMGDVLEVRAKLPQASKARSAVAIGVGTKAGILPAQGVALTGTLPELDLLALTRFGGLGNSQQSTLTAMPLQADVTIGELHLGKQALGAAQLTLTSAQTVQAQLIADKLQASLNLPLQQLTAGRVVLDLQQLDFAALETALPSEKSTAQGLSAKHFPALQVTCRECRHGDFPIQYLKVVMQPRQDALAIQHLEVRNPSLTFRGEHGTWVTDAAGESRTVLQTHLSVPDPGRLLASDGKPAGLQGGVLQASAKLSWEGSPFDFTLKQLQGDGQMTLGKGALVDVEPGVGRLLGLLDVQRLPSRLALDFQDMTAKGVAFDEISGHFRLNRGVLSTDDTVIKAAAMVAGIRGSSDLIARTHQQQVTVLPNLRSALPIVGVAVGGVGGGALMLLFNSVTHKDAAARLQSSGGIRYEVTGSWDKPNITEVKPLDTKADVDVFAH
ncbi:YhdP family phospholipid transporter [Candidatus Thiothrix anitrata]|uniref:YhdP central domain-containing protein n=1 Tax=Candidatus Thiothrix anitrata TaxID=2823902 RepID=A0ABX7X045_9GAMM|nr:DUF3971 domain-containing protein [Candidatus Thiothrix anitrata]QTR49346.1 hypothetical protein J8380_13965 [Candidatus Thiothrix anitrata]